MPATPNTALPTILAQHVEEAAVLRTIRTTQVTAPDVRLLQLGRLDERIAAHLDGIAVAGEAGHACCASALDTPGIGKIFTASVRAIESQDREDLEELIELITGLPEGRGGLISAFGWVSPEWLQGLVSDYLAASDPLRRWLGIASCNLHRADPGSALSAAIDDPDEALRIRALRTAGECGRVDLLPACLDRLGDDDPHCRLHAARAALLLGDRAAALEALRTLATTAGSERKAALRLYLAAAPIQQGHALLHELSADAEVDLRVLIEGAGVVGDPQYLPWLFSQLGQPGLARLAGEAISLITGLDLNYLELERPPADEAHPDRGENPDDDDVALDPGESLPWPDPVRVAAWWQAKGGGFATGVRHFMGKPLGLDHCAGVLRDGYQRQRAAAALHSTLLAPGLPLFNVAAPAWRQRTLLAATG